MRFMAGLWRMRSVTLLRAWARRDAVSMLSLRTYASRSCVAKASIEPMPLPCIDQHEMRQSRVRGGSQQVGPAARHKAEMLGPEPS